MKFKTLEMAKQEVPGQIRIPQGLDVRKARQRSGGPGLLLPHSPGLLAQGCHLLADGREGHPGLGGRGSDAQGSREGGRNEHRGSGHGGPGRNDWGQDRGHD